VRQRHWRRFAALLSAGVVPVIAISACGSAAGGGSSGGGSAGAIAPGAPIKVGFLESTTGDFAAFLAGDESGIKAVFDKVNAAGGVDGHKLQIVVANDQSTPQGGVTAVQQLVSQDKVFGIVSGSVAGPAIVPFLRQQGTPIVGWGNDGTYWGDPANPTFFGAASSVASATQGSTTFANLLKRQGGTKLALVAPNIPTSVDEAQYVGKTAGTVGIHVVYTNYSLPETPTDLTSVALAIKHSGANSIFLPNATDFNVSLLTALNNQNVHLKAVLTPTGWPEVLQSQAATGASQNAIFTYEFACQPEISLPGGSPVLNDLKKYTGYTGSHPLFAQCQTWLAASAFVAGLKKTGKDITPANFVKAMKSLTRWDGDGTLPGNYRDFSNKDASSNGTGSNNCVYVAQLKGSKFVPLQGAKPFCGSFVK
jgi:branched-chain amino acid transport system substrate-binding protein